MRLVKFEGDSKIRLIDAPDPVPGPGEVVIETAASAICGSELHSYRGDGSETGNSGHEGVGTIVELGDGVTGLSTGDRVGTSAIAGCGTCAQCAAGRYTWCADFRFYGNMHAQRYLAAASSCYVLPDDIAWDAGVLLTGDGFGVPYHTSTKLRSDDIQTVAVFGSGPIGLGNILLQHHLGRKVIAVDLSVTRLELARELGATETIDAGSTDPVDAIKSLTDGGADVCIEAAGQPETALACFAATRTNGTVVFNGEQSALELSPSDHFIRRDITAVGSWFYHFCEIAPMIEAYRDGLDVTLLITHRYPHESAAEAYEDFSSGKTGKAIINWESAAT